MFDNASNNDVEFKALIEGLWICTRLNLNQVEIEGDSTLVINFVRNQLFPNWRLNSLLTKALNLVKRIKFFTINHIYREGNDLIDKLVNDGVDGIEETIFYAHPFPP